MAAIDTARRFELEHLVRDLRLAARTIRAQTLEERRNVRTGLAEDVRLKLEPHAQLDEQGLERAAARLEALLPFRDPRLPPTSWPRRGEPAGPAFAFGGGAEEVAT